MQKNINNSNNRTFTQLLNSDMRVYLYIRNSEVWKFFCYQAQSEGFTWSDGRKLKRVKYDDIIAMNKNMTFNYLGWAGRILAHSSDDRILRIDFAKFISGADDYILDIPSKSATGENENTHQRLKGRSWEYIMFDDDQA